MIETNTNRTEINLPRLRCVLLSSTFRGELGIPSKLHVPLVTPVTSHARTLSLPGRVPQEVGICLPEALFQWSPGSPAEARQPGYVHQFAWCSIGLRRVVNDIATVFDHVGHNSGKF